MTGNDDAGNALSKFGAIAGIALVAVALMTSVPVVMNLPRSWPGAVLVLSGAGIGVALIVSHIRLGHKAKHQLRKDDEKVLRR